MMKKKNKLAIYGGSPAINKKLPNRFLYTNSEKKIVNKLINDSIKSGIPFRYSEYYERLYEKKFIKFMGGGYADAVNSGTNALFSIVGSFDFSEGSEIIVPILTDVGGVTPIIFWGYKPVIADISKCSYNVGLEEIKTKITNKTKAVIVCHIGGEAADIIPIKRYLKKRKIILIEDCSQSHGAKIKNQKIGTFGDIAFFSTMSSKLHSTGGQGAIIFSKNMSLIDRVKSVSDRGKIFSKEKFTGNYNFLGINSNLDELSAAIGCIQIDKLKKIIDRTNYIGEYIKKKLNKMSDTMNVGKQIKDTKNVYWFVRVSINLSKIRISKSNFCKALIAEGIPMASEYDYNPFKYKWYKSKKTLSIAKSHGFDLDRNTTPNNYLSLLKTDFVIFVRESFSNKDIDLIIKALIKVEQEFRK